MDNEDNWGNYSFQVFVELNDPARKEDVDAKIRLLLQEHKEDEIKPEMFLYPMSRWRLFSNFENGVEKGGMSDFVQLFSLIAVLILMIACINFMNMATARSEKRAKEVGIRKTVGSTKGDVGTAILTRIHPYFPIRLPCGNRSRDSCIAILQRPRRKTTTHTNGVANLLADIPGTHPYHRAAFGKLPGVLPVIFQAYKSTERKSDDRPQSQLAA
ncbi:MAG: hypothetical protein U5K79_02160 [Cyclobacteriaceae bacterium]|nr:hypothetical protein [Cyclobacteriaceae bacterium]